MFRPKASPGAKRRGPRVAGVLSTSEIRLDAIIMIYLIQSGIKKYFRIIYALISIKCYRTKFLLEFIDNYKSLFEPFRANSDAMAAMIPYGIYSTKL